jgi:hypothetical protein
VFVWSLSMRITSMAAYAVAALTFCMTFSTPSEAFGWRRDAPVGWGQSQKVRHWIYYPRYHHRYHRNSATDPHGYRWVKPRYYPYYNSGYWRSAAAMRARHKARYPHVPYYRAWGYPKRGYKARPHRRWHHHRRWSK